MPLERPTRGVQGFLGVKWCEAIGGETSALVEPHRTPYQEH